MECCAVFWPDFQQNILEIDVNLNPLEAIVQPFRDIDSDSTARSVLSVATIVFVAIDSYIEVFS